MKVKLSAGSSLIEEEINIFVINQRLKFHIEI